MGLMRIWSGRQNESRQGRALLRAPRTEPYVRHSRIRLPPRVSDGKQPAVCGPVLVTRFPGPVPGTCFAVPHSPRPPPFAPPAPQLVTQPCSQASSLLWRSLTSPSRASPASVPHLPGADQPLTPLAGREISRFPGKEHPYMLGSLTAPGRLAARDNATVRVAFRHGNAVGTRDKGLIPAALKIDARPNSMRNRPDTVWIADQKMPCIPTRSHDCLVAVPHAHAELVAAQVVPDVLHRIEFRRVGWQRQQRDVVWHAQPFAALMPASTVANQHRV